MHWKRTLVFAVSAAVAPLVAFATIPSNGIITACYAKSGGTMRVIDPTVTTCKSSETKLTWPAAVIAAPVSGYEIVTNTADIPAGSLVALADLSASCSAGKNVFGGGATIGVDSEDDGRFSNTNFDPTFNSSPTCDGTGWIITYSTPNTGHAARVTVYALCADVAP